MGRRFEPLGNPTRDRAKRLRSSMSDAEKLLWFLLRDRRFSDYKFRRQRPIGRYVVDFVCLDRMLVVELDGLQHAHPEQAAFDAERTQYLETKGYRVHRIWAGHLYVERDAALKGLWRALQ
jgi:very-short-patch-repair endonuclease